MADPVIPPPPPGFTVDEVPPPPPGFKMDGPPQETRKQGVPGVRGEKPKSYGFQDILGPTEANLSLLTGAIAAPVSGAAAIIGGLMPGPQGQSRDWANKTQQAMTYEPRTKLGGQIAGLATAPFEAWSQGADAITERVIDPAKYPATAAGIKTGIEALPMALGVGSKSAVNRARVLAETEADVRRKLAEPKDAAIKYAADKGILISPAEANPSLLNRIAEGFSGQSKVQLQMSAANQPTYNNIVRSSFGIPKDVVLDIDSLAAVRKEWGKKYDSARNIGEVPLDSKYGADLDGIVKKYEGAEKSFPAEKSEVQKAVDSARTTVSGNSFDASAAIDKISIERGKADKAFRQGDKELGKAHKAIADAIEAQIDRHLDSANAKGLFTPAMINDMRQARQVIAKTYDVQKHLDAGGNVDVRGLAKELKKGKLSGDLKDIAEVGAQFPGSSMPPGKNAPTIGSWGDIGMGGLGGVMSAVSGHSSPGIMGGIAAAATLSRPAIRAALSNKSMNKIMASNSYDVSPSLRLADVLTKDPILAGMLAEEGAADAKRRMKVPQ